MTRGALAALAESFAAAHPRDAARLLSEVSPGPAAEFLESCPPTVAAGVAQRLTAQDWVACLRAMSPAGAAAISKEMAVEKLANAVRRLTPEERRALAESLPADTSRALRSLLRYEEDTAGFLMESAVPAVGTEVTAGQALESVTRSPTPVRFPVYVVDDRERLVGVVDLRSLGAGGSEPVASLMAPEVHRLPARTRREAILEHPGWRQAPALPVIDENNVLVGVLRSETARALVQGERGSRRESPTAALFELYWSGSQKVAGELLALAARRSS